MSLLRLFIRVTLKLFASHLLFPIVAVFTVESLWQLIRSGFVFPDLWRHWSEDWIQLVFHGIAFGLIVMWVANERLAVTLNRTDLLDEYLENATNYFAIATIRLPEWFQPATQVYFAKILSFQHARPPMKPSFHQRVLLFFSESDLEATRNTAFDQHPAECLNEVHALNRIPLGYLDRNEIFRLLAAMQPEQRAALRWCRWYVTRFPALLALARQRWIPSALLLRPRRHLAFAVITFGGNTRKVILFVKKKRDLEIKKVDDDKTAQAYVALAHEIRRAVFPLKPSTSFQYFLNHTDPEVVQ